jgi:hypothetical protein
VMQCGTNDDMHCSARMADIWQLAHLEASALSALSTSCRHWETCSCVHLIQGRGTLFSHLT